MSVFPVSLMGYRTYSNPHTPWRAGVQRQTCLVIIFPHGHVLCVQNVLLRRCYLQVYKLKCTLVQALRFCTGRTAHRGSRGIALLFHDHGTRRGWWVSVTPRALFSPGKNPVPIVQEAGWAPGPVWTGAENFASPGVRSPDRPARSQSLYRLSYPANYLQVYIRPKGEERAKGY